VESQKIFQKNENIFRKVLIILTIGCIFIVWGERKNGGKPKGEKMTENREKLNEILLEMERFRQEHEYDDRLPDWYIRHCQAIVANAAGYEDRVKWCLPIEEQVQAERKAKEWEEYENMKKGA